MMTFEEIIKRYENDNPGVTEGVFMIDTKEYKYTAYRIDHPAEKGGILHVEIHVDIFQGERG